MSRQDGKCSVGPTNIPFVGGKKWHSVCDVNVVVVKYVGAKASALKTPNEANIYWP